MQYRSVVPRGERITTTLTGGNAGIYGGYGSYGGYATQPQSLQVLHMPVPLQGTRIQMAPTTAMAPQTTMAPMMTMPLQQTFNPVPIQQPMAPIPMPVQRAVAPTPMAIVQMPAPPQVIPRRSRGLVPFRSYGNNNVRYSVDGRIENVDRYRDGDYFSRGSPYRTSDGFRSLDPAGLTSYRQGSFPRGTFGQGTFPPGRSRSWSPSYGRRGDSSGDYGRGRRPRDGDDGNKKQFVSSRQDAGAGDWYGGWYGQPRRRSIELKKDGGERGGRGRDRGADRGRYRSNSLPSEYRRADKAALISAWSHSGEYGDISRFANGGGFVGGKYGGGGGGKYGGNGRPNYSQTRPTRWLFLVSGGLLVALAVFIILFGCPDQHYQAGFWAGGALIFLGVCGYIHRGRYGRDTWRTWLYVITGIVTSVACMAGTAFVMQKLVPEIKKIVEVGIGNYILLGTFVSTLTTNAPITLNTTARVWACLAVDVIMVMLFLVGCYAMTSAVGVASSHFNILNYFKSNYQRSDPYCRPRLFNPFLQVPLGLAACWLGILATITAEGTSWTTYWSPAWAAPLAILGGSMAGFARKRPDRKFLIIVAICCEVLAVGACVAASIILLRALVDVTGPMTQFVTNLPTFTGYSNQVQGVSAALLAVTMLLFAIVGVIAVAVTVLLITAAMRKYRKPRRGYYR